MRKILFTFCCFTLLLSSCREEYTCNCLINRFNEDGSLASSETDTKEIKARDLSEAEDKCTAREAELFNENNPVVSCSID